MRLTSRLVDLPRLAAPDGSIWLAAGALLLPRRTGVACVAQARGQLVHGFHRMQLAAVLPTPG